MTRQNRTKLSYYLTLTAAIAVIGSASPAWAGGPHAPALLPAHPNAGECYVRVKIPAQYSTSHENVIVEDGYETLETVDPVLQSRQEQVLIKEASVKYVVRQPRYQTVMDKIMTRPSYDKLSVTPPSFSTVTETVQTSSPRLVWKRGNPVKLRKKGYVIHSTADAGYRGQGYGSAKHYGSSGGELCGSQCEIWCLVEEPGESVSFNRRVLSTPAQVRRVNVPAQYQHISKQVVSDPGGVEKIPVPAEFRSVTVQDIVRHGGEHSVHVPAKYGSVAKRTLISPERYEWRRAVCAPGTGNIAPQTSYQPSGYGHAQTSGSSHQSITYGGPAHTSRSTTYNHQNAKPAITYRQRQHGQTTCTNRSC